MRWLIRDISNRKKSEEALRRYASLASRGCDIVLFMRREDGRIIEANAAAIKAYGYGYDNLLMLTIHDLRAPDARMLTIGQIAQVESGGILFETFHQRKDGSIFPVEVSTWGETIEGTHTLLSVIRDITERMHAEEALRHSEQQYRLLFETMPNGVIFQDAAGKIISMNSAAESILGKTPAEFVGHTSASVEHHTIREDSTPFPCSEHPSTEALRTGVEIKDIVMGVYNPREQCYRWLNINSVPLFRAGESKPYQVYTTFEDITERKHMEDELTKSHDDLEWRVKERTAELHQADEQLRSLASELLNSGENERKLIAQEIHDGLSSQLSAIKFYLERELCVDRDEVQSGESIRQTCTMIQDAIEETRRIMANLRPPILDDLGILPTITRLCREFQKMNPSIHPVIKFEISEEDIPGDIKTVIFRMLQEALNNTREYSRADRVEISLRRIGSLVVFSISDNGQGFNPKKVLSTEKIGHGFGLRGMLERVKLSGGKFVVKSVPGKGVLIWAEWSIKS